MSESRQEPFWEKVLSQGQKLRKKVRVRTSTVVLLLAFVATSWLYDLTRPEPAPPQPPTGYTWVPKPSVTTTTPRPVQTTTRRPTTTTPPTTTTTTEPTNTIVTTFPTLTPSGPAPTPPTTTPPPPPGILPPWLVPPQLPGAPPLPAPNPAP
ncbi:hypothetical protein HNP40_000721 [Mycobacteroides chelonae]|nr:hypothetical protein [Mycobacteroides chelonae]